MPGGDDRSTNIAISAITSAMPVLVAEPVQHVADPAAQVRGPFRKAMSSTSR